MALCEMVFDKLVKHPRPMYVPLVRREQPAALNPSADKAATDPPSAAVSGRPPSPLDQAAFNLPQREAGFMNAKACML